MENTARNWSYPQPAVLFQKDKGGRKNFALLAGRKSPDKQENDKVNDDPNSWMNFIDSLPPWAGGAIMAFFVSVLRLVYDSEETTFQRIMLEAAICGSLTVAAGSALDAMGFGQNWYLACGGMIGFMGSQSVRVIAYKIIDRKVK